MSSSRGKYSPEFRTEAVREVIDKSRAVADVARELGLVPHTLTNWVAAYRRANTEGEEEPTVHGSQNLSAGYVNSRRRIFSWEKHPRSLRRSSADYQAGTDSSRRTRLHPHDIDPRNVSTDRCEPVQLRRMARPEDLENSEMTNGDHLSHPDSIRRVRRHLRLPPDRRAAGVLGPPRGPRNRPPAPSRRRPGALPAQALATHDDDPR